MHGSLLSFATIDSKSNIIYQDSAFRQLFNTENILYDSVVLSPFKEMLLNQDKLILEKGIGSQILLINICENNIILKKTPIISYNQIVGINLLSEIFSINPLKHELSKNIKLNSAISNEHKYVTGYSPFQQQIIFCLLMGMQSDKEIANFMNKITFNIFECSNIRNGIREIFKKLFVSNRECLINCLFKLNFDKHIPDSLFPKGVYLNLFSKNKTIIQ